MADDTRDDCAMDDIDLFAAIASAESDGRRKDAEVPRRVIAVEVVDTVDVERRRRRVFA